jgi:hypothetical protein
VHLDVAGGGLNIEEGRTNHGTKLGHSLAVLRHSSLRIEDEGRVPQEIESKGEKKAAGIENFI